jgi:putative flippase GtrA
MIGELAIFGVVGIAATVTHYGAALLFVELFGISSQISNLIGFWIAFGVSYFGQSVITFRSRPSLSNFSKYAALAIFNYLMSAGVLYLLERTLDVDYRVALMVIVILVPLVSYIISKHFIFRSLPS